MTRPLVILTACLTCGIAAAQPTTQPFADLRRATDAAEQQLAARTVERDAAVARSDELIARLMAQSGELAAARAEIDHLRPKLAVGLNLDENTDYATDAAWANLFMRFTGWGKPDDPTKPFAAWVAGTEPPPQPDRRRTSYVNSAGQTIVQEWGRTDANGNPTEDVGAFTYATGYAAGDYAFRMDGSGIPRFSGRGRSVAALVRDGNTVVGTVRIEDGAQLLRFSVVAVDPANPPRNFRLVVPGLPADTAQFANPAFAKVVAPFPGPLRVSVGPQRINATEAGAVRAWGERVKPGDFPQTTRKGCALESILALANECGKDVWLSVPDAADDDYIRQLGAMVRDRLALGRRAFVQYSNESIFNTRFPQWQRVHDAARANPDLTATDENERHWQQEGWQAHRLGALLKPILGDRVRIVLGGQASYAWNSQDRVRPGPAEVALDYVAAKFGLPAQWIDILAVACYRDAGSDASSVAAIVAGWDASLASPDLRAKDARHLAVARKYGLRLWAYESAITVRGRQAPPDPRDVAQVDPRAGERVTALLAYAESAGFDGVAYFIAVGKRAQQTEGHYPLAESLLTVGTETKWSAAAAFAALARN